MKLLFTILARCTHQPSVFWDWAGNIILLKSSLFWNSSLFQTIIHSILFNEYCMFVLFFACIQRKVCYNYTFWYKNSHNRTLLSYKPYIYPNKIHSKIWYNCMTCRLHVIYTMDTLWPAVCMCFIRWTHYDLPSACALYDGHIVWPAVCMCFIRWTHYDLPSACALYDGHIMTCRLHVLYTMDTLWPAVCMCFIRWTHYDLPSAFALYDGHIMTCRLHVLYTMDTLWPAVCMCCIRWTHYDLPSACAVYDGYTMEGN